jgi:hypothetical protein
MMLKPLLNFIAFSKPEGACTNVNLAAFNFLKGEHSLAGHEERRYTKPKLSRASQQVRGLL